MFYVNLMVNTKKKLEKKKEKTFSRYTKDKKNHSKALQKSPKGRHQERNKAAAN